MNHRTHLFAFADDSSGLYPRHPHLLTLHTDPAAELYVPGAELTLSLNDWHLNALDAAIHARFSPEQRLTSLIGRLTNLRASTDAFTRTRVAGLTAHVLGLGQSPLVDSVSGAGRINFRADVAC